MSQRYGSSSLPFAGAQVYGFGGLGVLGSEILALPAGLGSGESVLRNDVDAGDEAKEFWVRIEQAPASGVLAMDSYGRFSLTGAADGSYSLVYRLVVDGTDLGTATDSITVGSATSSVTSDLGCSFVVRGAVQSSLAASYALRAAVQSDLVASYSVLAGVTADLACSYALRGAVVADLPCTYNLAGVPLTVAVTADLMCGFNVLGRVTRDLACNFVINGEQALSPTRGYEATFRATSLVRTKPRTRVPSKDPQESVMLGFDFSGECENVLATRISVATLFGTDEAAEDILVGSAFTQGAKVFQRVAGGLNRVKYTVACVVDTNDGDTLMAVALLPVRFKALL